MSKASISGRQSRRWIVWTLGSYLLALFLRTWSSLDRIAADPGYWVFETGRTDLSWSFITGYLYFNVVARLIPAISGPFPIEMHAVVGGSLSNFVWLACAGSIVAVLRATGYSRTMAYLGGLALVLAPHASESSLGNSGPIGFPLLVPLLVCSSMPEIIRRWPTACALLAAISAITTPFTFIGAAVLLLRRVILRERVDRAVWLFVIASSMSLWLNLIKLGPSRIMTGNGNKLFMPWNGMGWFWWSGLVGPILISCGVISVWLLLQAKGRHISVGIALLAAASVSLQVSLYWLGGIGDRYFVAPMTLSLISLLLLMVEAREAVSKPFQVLVLFCVIVVVATPSIKWFSAGNFLSQGPAWSAEVQRSQSQCRDVLSESVLLRTGDAEITLSCRYLLGRYRSL